MDKQIENFTISPASTLEENDEGTALNLHLKGVLSTAPESWGRRISLYFQRIELIEKIAEIADEGFHLLGPLFQLYLFPPIYQSLRQLHHAAHDIEHLLHPFCFFGDITRIFRGNFFENFDDEGKKQTDYLFNASRLFHLVSHCLGTVNFLQDLKILSVGRFQKIFFFAPVISAAGYSLATISLIWCRAQGKANKNFSSDLAIQAGGGLFQGLHFVASSYPARTFTPLLKTASSFAGIIHAWCFAKRLMPADKIEVAKFHQFPYPLANSGQQGSLVQTPHDHHSHSHHHHSH